MFATRSVSVHSASVPLSPSVSATCGSLPFYPVSVLLSIVPNRHLFQMSQDEPLPPALPLENSPSSSPRIPCSSVLVKPPQELQIAVCSHQSVEHALQSLRLSLQKTERCGEVLSQGHPGSRGECRTDKVPFLLGLDFSGHRSQFQALAWDSALSQYVSFWLCHQLKSSHGAR